MSRIDPDRADREFGIVDAHETMPNGEYRFRLKSSDGSAYIRTVAGEAGAWQQSHYHHALRETYIVQSGWMVLASLRNTEIELLRVDELEIVTTEPGVHHNVYLPSGAVIHTVKYGTADGKDWWPSAECDAATRGIDEPTLLALPKSPYRLPT